jgi:hypothetical protein
VTLGHTILSARNEPQGPTSPPADLQPPAQFLVGHAQVALRLLEAGVPEHQLDDADVHAIS